MKRFDLRAEKSERLDIFLRRVLPPLVNSQISNSKIRRLIVAGTVSVSGRQCRLPSFVLRGTESVTVSVDEDRLFYEKQPDDILFTLTEKDLLYEDDYIIVVNKPAFISTEETVVKGRANLHQCVVDYLWKKNPSLRNPPYAGIMHRLDRETSGVILFTKSRSANAGIHGQFESHTVIKKYRAVCAPAKAALTLPDEFSVRLTMGRISAKSSQCKMGLLSPSKGGQDSHTDFKVSSFNNGLYYVDALLHTGRTHQIRFHLSQKGFPILGDTLYGGRTYERIMLHSYSLTFVHPISGKEMTVTAPLPQGFAP